MDYGIIGMVYKTSNGKTGSIGEFGTSNVALYESDNFSKKKYTLPNATNSE